MESSVFSQQTADQGVQKLNSLPKNISPKWYLTTKKVEEYCLAVCSEKRRNTFLKKPANVCHRQSNNTYSKFCCVKITIVIGESYFRRHRERENQIDGLEWPTFRIRHRVQYLLPATDNPGVVPYCKIQVQSDSDTLMRIQTVRQRDCLSENLGSDTKVCQALCLHCTHEPDWTLLGSGSAVQTPEALHEQVQ